MVLIITMVLISASNITRQEYTFVLTSNDSRSGEINISAAEHLDEDYNFISDIYDEIKDKDGVWSGAINSGEFVRVTYEDNLTNGNVIDVFVRGSGSFEVFERDGSISFGNSGIVDSADGEWEYITLESVNKPTDVFDFKISGSLEFDYIHDAPSLGWVVLNSTSGNNLTSDNLTVYTDQDDNSSLKLIYNWKKEGSSFAVLNMPFEGGSNLTWTKDYSDLGNNGAVTNAIFNSTGGYDGRGAFEFDGVDGKIEVDYSNDFNFSNISGFTVMAWVKPNDLVVNDADIVTQYHSPSDNRGWILQIRNGKSRFVGCSNGSDLGSCEYAYGTTLANESGTWYHLAGTWNGSKLQIYLNGVAEDNTPPTLTFMHSSSRSIRLGYDAASEDFNGTMDDVMIFNRSLSAEQISALYNNRTDLVVSQETSAGEVWQSCVTPNDGAEDGSDVCSNILTINSPPSIDTVILNSTSGTNLTIENLTAYATTSDPDGDSVKSIYNWKKDGSSIAVLNMPFEGGSNSTFAKDYSDLGNNGAVTNAIFNSTGGYDGRGAFEFDGVDGKIEVDYSNDFNFSNISGFTVMAWVKPNDLVVNDADIVTQYHSPSNNRSWILQIRNGVPRFVGCSNGSDSGSCKYATGTTLANNSGTWYHLAGTWNGSKLQVYLNGVADASTPPTLTSLHSGARSIRLGYDAASEDYNGTMDDVMIFNRSLSAEQISALYNNRTDLIVSQETSAGEVWQSCVTPNDGIQDGNEVCSNNLTVIVDNPPNVTLVSPSDNYVNDTSDPLNVTFECNATDNVGLENISLYITNSSDQSFSLNQTINISGTSNSSSWILELGSGNYTWNCLAYDDASQSDWGDNNRSLRINYTAPPVNYNFTYLTNETTTTPHGYLNGTLNNTFYNDTIYALQLNATYNNGTFISQIFNVGSTSQWNNISWLSNVGELPNNQQSDVTVNLSENIVLYHLNNDSSIGETNSIIVDSSGNNNNATHSNTVWNTTSKFGDAAVEFDSLNDAILMDNNLNDMARGTIMMWWRPNTGHGINRRDFVGMRIDDNNRFYIVNRITSGDPFQFYVRESNVDVVNFQTPRPTYPGYSADNWHHIAYTWADNTTATNGSVKFYFNGFETATYSNSSFKMINFTSALQFGNRGVGDPDKDFDGIIDEIVVFNRNISSEEVLNIYKGGIVRLNLSTRSCDDSSCDVESWADITDTSPQTLSLTDNQYFQYKFDFATDNVSYSPELYNVTVSYTLLDATPPASVTNLTNQSAGSTWIYWNWTNPTDGDFNESIIYINGSNVANTSNNYYNATGLTADTNYTITLHTKDTTGNVNDTDVNSTASTLAAVNTAPTIINITDNATTVNAGDVVGFTAYFSDPESNNVKLLISTDSSFTNCDYNTQSGCLANSSASSSSPITTTYTVQSGDDITWYAQICDENNLCDSNVVTKYDFTDITYNFGYAKGSVGDDFESSYLSSTPGEIISNLSLDNYSLEDVYAAVNASDDSYPTFTYRDQSLHIHAFKVNENSSSVTNIATYEEFNYWEDAIRVRIWNSTYWELLATYTGGIGSEHTAINNSDQFGASITNYINGSGYIHLAVSEDQSLKGPEIDYVYVNITAPPQGSFNVDNPPNVTLSLPVDNYANDTSDPLNVTFDCNATDDIELANISLYITDNTNSSFSLNSTTNISGTSNSSSWNLSLGNGNYTWNCLAYDNSSNSDWGDSNRTVKINYISSFNGTVRDLTGSLISNANVSVLGTSYSTLTPTGIYSITADLSGLYDLKALKTGYLSQTKSNQLAEYGRTKEVNFNLGELGGIKGNVLNFWTSVGINNANLSLFLYDEFLNSTLTNSSGYYRFSNLAPGYYDLNVEAIEYESNSKSDVHVLGGQNATVNFWLW